MNCPIHGELKINQVGIYTRSIRFYDFRLKTLTQVKICVMPDRNNPNGVCSIELDSGV